ncbi:MAG: glycosyltransferase family 4 protein [Gemmatimonadota bacterium]
MAIRGLRAALAAAGHEVVLLRPRWRFGPLDIRRLLYNSTLAPRLRRGSWDLVVGFDFDGCFVPRTYHRQLVVCLKGILADESRFERGLSRNRLRSLALLERRNVRRAARVIVTSRYCHHAALSAYGLRPERVRVVPEGIDLRAWSFPSREARRPGRSDAETRTILCVGRQYPRKNTTTLLRALPEILRHIPEARLRLVGGGPQIPVLRTLAARLGISGRTTFVGELADSAAVRAEYERADLFCHPSLQEGFGIVLLEAMAAGLPIVASRAGAIPEVVPDGVAGLLVDGRSPSALAAALVRLLRDPLLASRMGAAGRRRVRRYSWPSVAEDFLRQARDSCDTRTVPPT